MVLRAIACVVSQLWPHCGKSHVHYSECLHRAVSEDLCDCVFQLLSLNRIPQRNGIDQKEVRQGY